MLLCYQCKQEKDESEFYKDKKRKTWYRCYCKECESKRKKEYRESHLEQVREREREYEKKNIDKIRGYKRKYVERHRKELYAKKSADHIKMLLINIIELDESLVFGTLFRNFMTIW